VIGSGPRIVTSRHRMLCGGRAAVQGAQLRTVSFPHLIESGNHNREERGEKRRDEKRQERSGEEGRGWRGRDGGHTELVFQRPDEPNFDAHHHPVVYSHERGCLRWRR